MRLIVTTAGLLLALVACTKVEDPCAAAAPRSDVHQGDGSGGAPDGSGGDSTGSGGASDGTSDDAADAQTPDAAPGGSAAWAQVFDSVFPQDRVLDLSFELADGDWAALLLHWQTHKEKIYKPAKLVITGVGDSPITLAKVGLRLKGLSSLNVPPTGPIDPGAKFPLKIDFNRFGGPRLLGLDKLSLSNLQQDQTQLREQLAAAVYRAMGVPAPRTTFARVSIDGALIGLYAVVQPIDKRFLKERYGTDAFADEGNLYKCVHNTKGVCGLGWHGDAPTDYQLSGGDKGPCQPGYDACGLVLKSHEDDPAWNHFRDLVHLVDVLNHTPTSALEAALPTTLDVEGALRYLAVTFVLSSYDSYLGKSNNFYLYHRLGDDRFALLPWDFDGAYNGTHCTDLADPTCSGGGKGYPLIARIFAVPAWRARFRTLVQETLDGPFTVAWHAERIIAMRARIAPVVEKDPNQPVSFATWQALTHPTPLPGDVQNLLGFVAKRRADLIVALAAD